MKIFTSIFVFSFILFSFGCNQAQEKTELLFQLSDAKYIWNLTNNTSDSTFLIAFKLAKEKFNPKKDEFIDVLANQISIMSPNQSLASYFATFENKDKINFQSTNIEVISAVKNDILSAKTISLQVLKKRIENGFENKSFLSKLFTKTNVVITEITDKKTYSISINSKVDKNHFKNLLETQVHLGFYETYDISEIFDNLSIINKKLGELSENKIDEPQSMLKDTVKIDVENEKYANENPLFSILMPATDHDGKLQKGAKIGTSRTEDTSKVNSYLSKQEFKNLLPRNLILLWETNSFGNENNYFNLYAIKTSRDGKAVLSGDCIVKSEAQNGDYLPEISISMNAEGAKIWARMTSANVGKQIAIVINNSVYSCPFVMQEIKGGNSQITGNFSKQEAEDLANILNAGVMPEFEVVVIDK